MNVFEFMSASPWLTFFLVWILATPVVWVVSLPFRAINIAIRGWPPAHIDAAGKLKKIEQDKETGQ